VRLLRTLPPHNRLASAVLLDGPEGGVSEASTLAAETEATGLLKSAMFRFELVGFRNSEFGVVGRSPVCAGASGFPSCFLLGAQSTASMSSDSLLHDVNARAHAYRGIHPRTPKFKASGPYE
jgi:hypothetical protein